jgi:hypothetical protein
MQIGLDTQSIILAINHIENISIEFRVTEDSKMKKAPPTFRALFP